MRVLAAVLLLAGSGLSPSFAQGNNATQTQTVVVGGETFELPSPFVVCTMQVGIDSGTTMCAREP